MSKEVVHVLLVYSLESKKLITKEQFVDAHRALEAYAAAERKHLRDDNLEIVLIAADSEETIRHTHASYFNEEVGLPALEGLLA
jgi:hypothetical protein